MRVVGFSECFYVGSGTCTTGGGVLMEGCTIVDDPEIQLTSTRIAMYNIRNGCARGFKVALRAMGQMNITQGLPSLPLCV